MALQIWDGGEQRDMTPEEEAAWSAEMAAAEAAPRPVPELVEKRKLKLEMLATPWPPSSPTTNLLALINAAVASGSQEIQIEWADATVISRSRDPVQQMKAAAEANAGLSGPQGDALMDQLFINADARP